MIVVGSCYFLLTLLIPYDPNIDFVFPLTNITLSCMPEYFVNNLGHNPDYGQYVARRWVYM